MLRTRLWMGTLLIGLALAALLFDWQPWCPFLLLLSLPAAAAACYELVHLLEMYRLRPSVCLLGVCGVVLANWPAHVTEFGEPWQWILGTFTAWFLIAFLIEAAYFKGPNGAVARLALELFAVAYLGLLACFLLQLRWLPDEKGSLALALAVFVPKSGDIGAYFTGRFLGRHRLTPVLSPKKTWEGAAGGLAASVLVALGIEWLGVTLDRPVLRDWLLAAGFGLVVGVVAQLGDLMESLIKRDCERKDASQVVPGFGGVLDVLDSILFSAPVAYGFVVSCSWFVVRG